MKRGSEKLLLSLAFLLLGLTYTERAMAETVHEFLEKFHQDPAHMMQRLPDMVDEHGVATPRGYIPEDRADWDLLIQYRDDVRKEIMGESPLSPFKTLDDNNEASDSGPEPEPNNTPNRNNPSNIIDPGEIITSIVAMHNQKLTFAQLAETPFSDSYWPIYKGILGQRFGDRGFPQAREWSSNFGYINSHSAGAIFSSGNSNSINNLSPSEKYDALMGDMGFSLTDFMWRRGKYYQDKYGRIPKWMGICHGWSAAASMGAKYPKQPVVVKAVNGTRITLFPQDVKAMQAALWAFSYPAPKFAGSRCSVTKPQKNHNGRIIDPKCFDVSPDSWHVAIVNQLGVNKRGFVMDGTYDAEVWNFPLASYRYRYFNPQTLQESVNIEAATMQKAKFKMDKFPEFRNPKTQYVIGIYMDVTYASEIAARQRNGDVNPFLKTVRYIYDLELDANKNIIGGEWYSNAHPDFIWTFNKTDQAKTKEDNGILDDEWSIEQPIPARWGEAARRASGSGHILWTFLKHLSP